MKMIIEQGIQKFDCIHCGQFFEKSQLVEKPVVLKGDGFRMIGSRLICCSCFFKKEAGE